DDDKRAPAEIAPRIGTYIQVLSMRRTVSHSGDIRADHVHQYGLHRLISFFCVLPADVAVQREVCKLRTLTRFCRLRNLSRPALRRPRARRRRESPVARFALRPRLTVTV